MSAVSNDINVVCTDTPVGEFWMKINDGILVQSGFGSVPPELCEFLVDNHPHLEAVRRYFDGDVMALDTIDFEQKGGTFHQAVWRAMSTINPGCPVSYKQLAEMAGYPTALRAVGTACGANSLPLIVPCHRVVKADGSVGNYAYGTEVKAWLLAHEKRLQKL